MSHEITCFDNDEIGVFNRNDGKILVEFRQPPLGDGNDKSGNQTGLVHLQPDVAVQLGQLLIIRGKAVIDAIMEANKAAEEAAENALAWRDREDRVWYGEKGGERLSPKGADTDQADHSWDELEASYGPLTPALDALSE